MMDGFAIPHAKDHSIEEANVIIVQLNSKIDWKSLDGEGTDFIIALLYLIQKRNDTFETIVSSGTAFDA